MVFNLLIINFEPPLHFLFGFAAGSRCILALVKHSVHTWRAYTHPSRIWSTASSSLSQKRHVELSSCRPWGNRRSDVHTVLNSEPHEDLARKGCPAFPYGLVVGHSNRSFKKKRTLYVDAAEYEPFSCHFQIALSACVGSKSTSIISSQILINWTSPSADRSPTTSEAQQV